MAGGAGWAGAPAALLRSVRRLREVFEVCGRDPDGFLRVERVAALGLRFGQGEEVRRSGASPGRGKPQGPRAITFRASVCHMARPRWPAGPPAVLSGLSPIPLDVWGGEGVLLKSSL